MKKFVSKTAILFSYQRSLNGNKMENNAFLILKGRRKKKSTKKDFFFFFRSLCDFCFIHLLCHQLHLMWTVYAVYMNIKKAQVRKCIKHCQLVMVGDNQLTDLQRQADLLRRINEFKWSLDDTWFLLVSAGVTAKGEEGWLFAQQVELGATCLLFFYMRC